MSEVPTTEREGIGGHRDDFNANVAVAELSSLIHSINVLVSGGGGDTFCKWRLEMKARELQCGPLYWATDIGLIYFLFCMSKTRYTGLKSNCLLVHPAFQFSLGETAAELIRLAALYNNPHRPRSVTLTKA